MSPDWLQVYLEEATRRKLCTRIHCMTCGAMEFRKGVVSALTAATAKGPQQELGRDRLVIAMALAGVRPPTDACDAFEEAVRCLLFDLWSGIPLLHAEIRSVLSGSWAGEVLRKMEEHYAQREAERRAYEEFHSPANVQKRREEKKHLRRQKHAARLERKKERDRLWRENHGGDQA